MNANELVDELVWIAKNRGDSISRQLADIVHQQQAEIEILKQIIDANNLNQNIGQFVKPTNEPVAWISVLGIDLIGQKFTDVRVSLTKTDVASIPLYTHPVKELTDEEIIDLINKHIDYVPDGDGMKLVGVMDFARAILRKAQEK